MKFIKSFSIVLLTFFAITISSAQEKPKSPPEKTIGTINGATIEINYSSPSVKGRKIWGELVPLGQVWRAGANDATTFETSKEITINGSKLPAGKYSFFVIPNLSESVIIFNKIAKQWGAYKYNDKEDQLRVVVKTQITETSVEKLVYKINNDNVNLSWDTWNIGFEVK
ncbi:DUF2911 domain-containing protein [Flavobacterium adhaerens]|uniref:DUF2911 domain-containing protein n=1 Tax=Flavobacterium adhaerens TaxID=3149043 RepID=UPI0032B49734